MVRLLGRHTSVGNKYKTAGGASVPLNTDNKEYRQILAWVEAGNTIAEAD